MKKSAEQIPLSIVIIAKDEACNIADCIHSVAFASEVLVLVDGDSKDATDQIATELGARVIREPWRGFGPQKNLAVKLATYPWVLCLDADERVTPALASEILAEFSSLNPQTSYALPRLSRFLGRDIRHGGWYPDYQTRLFHRDFHNWNMATIHEQVESTQKKCFSQPLQHLVFRNVSQQIATNDRYSTLLAEKDWQQGKRFSLFRLLIKPFTKFFECYFLKLGWRDGLAGFIIAINAAHSMFLRQTKLWEKAQCAKHHSS